ncbi:cytochrome b/b6 domain-containing protein [Methanonatronarchaeum sp. AMET6-2]|uniref:cytochrome b/b6 domain-containing protein n=1 Tax=Methanonatronarchaeum sp. AMET6-2 TaxID=2933293 RepID=UPI0011FFBE42|nr:cytochrome b/b6 domain-containing protein [Methanonatronarchaeum sp. AMET6-2]RZN60955.1 MAG: hypothetical protein EF811_05585 [Methanonatronarchaeia archaeon]UOY10649.1 cytochrome b/b6 domain-containing protein [Methanonatronarchaeum sp. AMET6-2]
MSDEGKLIHRYGVNEIVQHWLHMLSVVLLIVTGFVIYYGAGWLDPLIGEFGRAWMRELHLWLAVVLLFAWILLVYNILLHLFEGKIGAYLLTKDDLRRMKKTLLNYVGKSEYESFSVYNESEGKHETMHAPFWKPFIMIESIFILIVFLTGISMWAPTIEEFWIFTPLIEWLDALTLAIIGTVAPTQSALGVARTLHILAAWYFVFEVIYHAWINLADPRAWEYVKAMFYRGTEDTSKPSYTETKK